MNISFDPFHTFHYRRQSSGMARLMSITIPIPPQPERAPSRRQFLLALTCKRVYP